MGILTWIVVGLIAGWLAGLVMKGGGYGVIGDIVLGIVGALVGGFLASAVFGIPDAISGFNLTTLIVAFIGAVIVVAIVRALGGQRVAG
ncbi:MAG: GlsB/YeaQ/YmgE family stress response membrane protein [Chloroflexi bacterium]|nr:GlsB/YeaQ/YmgE family stress response membrane protein [Chloroflexota bacterium]